MAAKNPPSTNFTTLEHTVAIYSLKSVLTACRIISATTIRVEYLKGTMIRR
jgi:hypothetical protein